MKNESGFSLVEVIVVVTIVVIVAAISYPVFSRAKEKSIEAKSISNMRQLHLAIEMYRSEYGGIPYGTLEAMGLPDSPTEKWLGSSVDALRPPTNPASTYLYYPVASRFDRRSPTWEQYVVEHTDATVLLADVYFNPSEPKGTYPSYQMNPDVEKYLIGITLGGSIRKKRSSGSLDMKWWDR
jgi:prepilin-type N-terminal cleavage/methylation domain-containing protein